MKFPIIDLQLDWDKFLRSPPAAPFGGNDVGITPAASFADVTEPSKILVVVIALVPIVGLG